MTNLQRLQEDQEGDTEKENMQKTLSSSQLKEMFSGADDKDDDEVVRPDDVLLEDKPELKKDEKELNAALIE